MFSGSTDIENSIFRDKKSPFDYESDGCIVRKYRLSRPLKMNELCSFHVLQWGTLYQLTIGTKNLFKIDRFLHNLFINESAMISVAIKSYRCTYLLDIHVNTG